MRCSRSSGRTDPGRQHSSRCFAACGSRRAARLEDRQRRSRPLTLQSDALVAANNACTAGASARRHALVLGKRVPWPLVGLRAAAPRSGAAHLGAACAQTGVARHRSVDPCRRPSEARSRDRCTGRCACTPPAAARPRRADCRARRAGGRSCLIGCGAGARERRRGCPRQSPVARHRGSGHTGCRARRRPSHFRERQRGGSDRRGAGRAAHARARLPAVPADRRSDPRSSVPDAGERPDTPLLRVDASSKASTGSADRPSST